MSSEPLPDTGEPTASPACPICGRDQPHDHTPEEIAEATRPDGSWRRRRPKHPYEACTLQMISISLPREEVEERWAYNRGLLQTWEDEMETWRRDG